MIILTGNAQSPRLDRPVAGTNRVDVRYDTIVEFNVDSKAEYSDVEPDRKRRHGSYASVSDVRCSVSGSGRGTLEHYRANSGRQGHTNGTEYAL